MGEPYAGHVRIWKSLVRPLNSRITMEVQPVANVARIAQMLTIPQDEAIALWRDVQEQLREALSMYAVAEAVKGCIQKRAVDLTHGQAKIEAEDIAGFIIAERSALQQAAEAEKRRKEYEERRQAIEARQEKLRRLGKQSRIAVAVAKSEKKFQEAVAKRDNQLVREREAVAKRANELLTERIRAARIEADTLVAAEKTAAAEKVATAEQAVAAQVVKAVAAETRAVAAENALAAERVAVQRVEAVNRLLEKKIEIAERKLSTTEKVLAAKVASAAHKEAAFQKTALDDSSASEKLSPTPQPPRARPQKAKAVPSRAAEIQQICKERGIEDIIHFTHLDNLRSILTNGLLGRSLLEARLDHSPVRFNDQGRYDGQRNAVCVSTGFPTYEMFFKYSKNNQASWVILVLEPALLWELDCAFCRDNAASTVVSRVPLAERKEAQAFREMFTDYRDTKRSKLGLPDDYSTHRQAEVLVCEPIPSRYIRTVNFYNILAGNQWIQANPGEYLKQFELVGGDDFFKPRLDWNRWPSAAASLPQRGYGSSKRE